MRASHQRKYPTVTCGPRHKNSKGALGGITQQPTFKDAFPLSHCVSKHSSSCLAHYTHTHTHREWGSQISWCRELNITFSSKASFIPQRFSRLFIPVRFCERFIQVDAFENYNDIYKTGRTENVSISKVTSSPWKTLITRCSGSEYTFPTEWSYSVLYIERSSMKRRHVAGCEEAAEIRHVLRILRHPQPVQSQFSSHHDRILLCEWRESWWGVSLTREKN